MAYTTVPTVNTGDTWTAANQNTYLRDNMAATAVGIVTTAGDLVYATALTTLTRLAIGAAGLVLISTGSAPSWGRVKSAGIGGRLIQIRAIRHDRSVAVANGIAYWTVPSDLNGYNVTSIHCAVSTASSSGTPTFRVYNATDSQYLLSTNVTIDANELTSYTAATQPVIDTDHDDLATGDLLRFDCTVSGTGTQGLEFIITVEKP